jgi:hypothetical protein
MKNDVFWDVSPCGSCKNRRFGGTSASVIRVTRIGELRTDCYHPGGDATSFPKVGSYKSHTA